MPRPPRKEFANALYHVTSRGNGRARIFHTDADYLRFLVQLQDCLHHDQVVLYAYVLMPNHYHLLVRTRDANLSRFMQRLNTSYALYARYKHKKPGHCLQGRYKAKLVQGDDYILTLTRYLHLNPVKRKAFRDTDHERRIMVLAKWPWSSYRGYIDTKYAEEFVNYEMLRMVDPDLTRARARYLAYTHEFLHVDDSALLNIIDQSGYGIGDETFIETLEAELFSRRQGKDCDRDVAYPRLRLHFDAIDQVVAAAFNTTPAALRSHGRSSGAGLARDVAMVLGCRLTGATQRVVGEWYGGISAQAVSHARKRIKNRISEDQLERLQQLLLTGEKNRNAS